MKKSWSFHISDLQASIRLLPDLFVYLFMLSLSIEEFIFLQIVTYMVLAIVALVLSAGPVLSSAFAIGFDPEEFQWKYKSWVDLNGTYVAQQDPKSNFYVSSEW